ncbi:MAG: PQQ-dependent sugar dehydrogenase [Pseudomonadota bacterium]|nr:PQQ-dependent sugar dehydrogenase [Pseudomonadota bacterium]
MTKITPTIAAPFIGAVLLSTTALAQEGFTINGGDQAVSVTPVTEFDEPWAMTFLPDGTMLVTEKGGTLLHVTQGGEKTEVSGVPAVAYGGQGGLGDVVLHPDFAENDMVYLSYAEEGEGGYGAALARGTLDLSGDSPALRDVNVIWRQAPKVDSQKHYSHRIAFSPDGMMFVTSGEHQEQTPAQDMDTNLGKIIRLNDDGSVPNDNPFQDQGDLARQFWSVGHRNMLGIAFDGNGQLWAHEMGPRGGDELNRIVAGENYGWPIVSNGDNYSGSQIPDHDTNDSFKKPEVSWNPVISPAGFVIYDGEMFPEWQGDGFIGGLSSKALIRVGFGEQEDGTLGAETERFDMGERIREVEQGPDGALWLLEDGDGGRLLKLTPQEDAS